MNNLTWYDEVTQISSANRSGPGRVDRMAGSAQVKFCFLYDFLIEALCMGTLCLFGFAGNTLSFLVLWREKSKYATPFLLMALAVADTMFLTTVMILRVMTSIYTYTRTKDAFSAHFPYIVNYVFPFAQMSLTGTVWLTVLVTLNRYVSVCKPYEVSQLCSKRQARRHVIVITLFSIIYSVPKFFEYTIGPKRNPHRNIWVYHAWPTAMGKNAIYRIVYSNIIYFLLVYILPLVILMTLNYKLVRALSQARRRRRQLVTHPRRHGDSTQCQEEDVTLTLIIVVVVFVVTQTPALVTQSFEATLHRRQTMCPTYYFYYSRISDLLVVANSSSNFLIYCFCSKRFRNILQDLMCGKGGDGRRGAHPPESTVGGSHSPRLPLTRSAAPPAGDTPTHADSRSTIKYDGLTQTSSSPRLNNGVAHV